MDEGKLWSLIRNVLSQGGAIQLDRASMSSYEEYSARLDAAAAERVADFTKLADARIAELERERNSLRDFANSVMDSWPHGDVDGAYLERMAVEHGLLALKYPRPTEPCGDNCACSGYPTPEEWAEGIDCYVRTPLLTGAEARAGNGGEG